jgi:hypothetical protein
LWIHVDENQIGQEFHAFISLPVFDERIYI